VEIEQPEQLKTNGHATGRRTAGPLPLQPVPLKNSWFFYLPIFTPDIGLSGAPRLLGMIVVDALGCLSVEGGGGGGTISAQELGGNN